MNSSSSVADLIGTDRTLADLTRAAAAFRKLDAALKRELTPGLADNCEAVCLRHGEVIVFARSGAVATKLKAMEARLANALAAAGWPVSRLKIRVRVEVAQIKKPKTLTLNSAALAQLDAAAQRVSDPALARTLARLVARRRAGGG